MDEFEQPNRPSRLRYPFDCVTTVVLEEEDYVDFPSETGHETDYYWARGWSSDFSRIARSNYDIYDGFYHMVFPVRNRLNDFSHGKSLRRVLQKNLDLKTTIRPLRITREKIILFEKHHYSRFSCPSPKQLTKTYEYIVHYPTSLMELCIFDDEKLLACSIFEKSCNSIMSNTAFWEPDAASRSLGILTVLKEIEFAIGNNCEFYYQGFYYPGNPNYQYKTRFSGLELFDWETENWVDFENDSVPQILNRKLPRRD